MTPTKVDQECQEISLEKYRLASHHNTKSVSNLRAPKLQVVSVMVVIYTGGTWYGATGITADIYITSTYSLPSPIARDNKSRNFSWEKNFIKPSCLCIAETFCGIYFHLYNFAISSM